MQINEKVRIIQTYEGATIIKADKKKNQFARHEINESGLEILKLCLNGISREAIIQQLRNKYNLTDFEIIQSIHDFIEEYINKGIIENGDSNSLNKNIYGHSKLISPVGVSFELTNACQLRCIHCFNDSFKAKPNEVNINKFILLAEELIDIGVQSFFVTGGEPFLKPGIDKLIELLGEKSTMSIFATNGIYYPKKYANLLKKYDQIGIQVSIDGLEKTHDMIRGRKGSFQQTVSNITKMIQDGKSVSVAFTINDYNFHDLEDVICLVKNLGCSQISIGITSNEGRAKENNIPVNHYNNFISTVNKFDRMYTTNTFFVGLDICEEQVDKLLNEIQYANKCGAGYQNIHVTSTGQITPCPALPELVLGDIREQSLSKILSIENLEDILNLKSPIKEVCQECPLLASCGNCIASAYNKNKEECARYDEIRKEASRYIIAG